MSLLVQDALLLAPLGSGSRGNCTYIGTEQRGVLVDCGLSTKQIYKRLADLGLADVTIDAVLLTHEHGDHVASAGVLSRALEARQGKPVPFHLTRGTYAGMHERIHPGQVVFVESGQTISVGCWHIEPFTVPHDTADPVAFAVELGGIRACVITDLGRSTRLVEQQLASCHLAILEFNHDLQMLMDGPYPWALKQRVRGQHGHLSNTQAANLLRRGASSRLVQVHLGHLSAENNRPELAHKAALEALHAAGHGAVRVALASQGKASPPSRALAPRGFEGSSEAQPRLGEQASLSGPDDAPHQEALF